jgi:hypothetical protein
MPESCVIQRLLDVLEVDGFILDHEDQDAITIFTHPTLILHQGRRGLYLSSGTPARKLNSLATVARPEQTIISCPSLHLSEKLRANALAELSSAALRLVCLSASKRHPVRTDNALRPKSICIAALTNVTGAERLRAEVLSDTGAKNRTDALACSSACSTWLPARNDWDGFGGRRIFGGRRFDCRWKSGERVAADG